MSNNRKSNQGGKRNSNSSTNLRIQPIEEPKSKLVDLSKKIQNSYILTIFEKIKDSEAYKCKVCPSNPKLEYKNLKRHILDGTEHDKNVPEDDKDNHKDLQKKLKETKKKIKKSQLEGEEKENGNDESSKHKKGYLKFAAACYNSKISFNQMQKIGLILKEIYLDNEISFLAKYNFSLDEIGNMANCWGEY